jgi:hypothetical protein
MCSLTVKPPPPAPLKEKFWVCTSLSVRTIMAFVIFLKHVLWQDLKIVYGAIVDTLAHHCSVVLQRHNMWNWRNVIKIIKKKTF